MSTRGAVGYFYKNEYRESYNHSNSYPEGLGAGVIEEVRKVQDWDRFKQNLEKVKWVNGGYVPTAEEKEKNKKFSNLSVSKQTLDDVYCLLRKVQGEAQIGLIYNDEISLAIDSEDFIKDSLFCEYAYVLNLDTMELELYSGYQKEPQSGNRFGEEAEREYYPCKLEKSFPLTDIPEDWLKQTFPEEVEEEQTEE